MTNKNLKTLGILIGVVWVIAVAYLFISESKSPTRIETTTTLKSTELEGTITLSGAWALYPMAVRWGEEFHKLIPKSANSSTFSCFYTLTENYYMHKNKFFYAQ